MNNKKLYDKKTASVFETYDFFAKKHKEKALLHLKNSPKSHPNQVYASFVFPVISDAIDTVKAPFVYSARILCSAASILQGYLLIARALFSKPAEHFPQIFRGMINHHVAMLVNVANLLVSLVNLVIRMIMTLLALVVVLPVLSAWVFTKKIISSISNDDNADFDSDYDSDSDAFFSNINNRGRAPEFVDAFTDLKYEEERGEAKIIGEVVIDDPRSEACGIS